jgi:palmitoyltransferase
MLSRAQRNKIAVSLWTARIIPIVLAGIVAYATYVVIALLSGKINSSAAIFFRLP